MYNFDIIELNDQDKNEKLQTELKFLISELYSSKDPSIIILGKGIEYPTHGGAYLKKKDINNIQDDLRELVSTFPLNGFVWECSNVGLDFSAGELCLDDAKNYFFRSFYRGLYRSMIDFGKLKGINFLVIKLSLENYSATKEFGLWPYVVELKPHQSEDGLFHGILPLSGS